MGFFSWKTSDTKKSVSNSYSSRGALPVYVLCPDGTKLKEENYDGYGKFAKKDIFELVAKWNDIDGCKDENGEWLDSQAIRNKGIEIGYGKNAEYPIKIVEDGNLNYSDVDASEDCPVQGYFYDDEEDDEHYF